MNDQQPQKNCVVCGMPLVKAEDYPEGDATKDYCKYCGTKDGLKSYPEILKGMTGFVMQSQGKEEAEASQIAKQMVDNSVAVKSGRLKVE